jgi:DNA-binding XRE family transcriptional regulator
MRISRVELAKELDVLPRTVARWEADQHDPSETIASLIILFFEERGAPRPLLEELAKAAYIHLLSLGIGPFPKVAFKPSAASQKVVDDAVREAAEDLGLEPRALRPVVSRLLEAIAQGGIPADAAAKMAVAREKKDGASRP